MYSIHYHFLGFLLKLRKPYKLRRKCFILVFIYFFSLLSVLRCISILLQNSHLFTLLYHSLSILSFPFLPFSFLSFFLSFFSSIYFLFFLFAFIFISVYSQKRKISSRIVTEKLFLILRMLLKSDRLMEFLRFYPCFTLKVAETFFTFCAYRIYSIFTSLFLFIY